MASAQATVDHDQIRDWVESRGGFPARVKATGGGDDPGILRIDFPGFSGADTLERINWDEWFEAFDNNGLAFLYQPGGRSRFSKLVDRSTVESTPRKATRTRRTASKKSSTRKASSAKRSSAKRSASKKASSKKSSVSRKRSTAKRSSSKSTAKKARSKSPSRRATGGTSRPATTTTNHKEIRRWVEARGGWPATVKATKTRGKGAGLLRIDYPGYSGKGTLERIDWDDFFRKFDREKLAFLYQDKKNSRFSKFVRR